MRDYLAWRLAYGITTPSTNTVVQPEYDDMRPAGVTNHIARMVIADNPVTCDADFEKQLEDIDAALEDAVARVMDAKPNAFILGISALSVWGGSVEWGEQLKARVRKDAGWDIPVTISCDAVPSRRHTNPTPHESRSYRGSYSPCDSGKPASTGARCILCECDRVNSLSDCPAPAARRLGSFRHRTLLSITLFHRETSPLTLHPHSLHDNPGQQAQGKPFRPRE